jgi:hypothetical protein
VRHHTHVVLDAMHVEHAPALQAGGATHVPEVHVAPEAHTRPHEPQLASSV